MRADFERSYSSLSFTSESRGYSHSIDMFVSDEADDRIRELVLQGLSQRIDELRAEIKAAGVMLKDD